MATPGLLGLILLGRDGRAVRAALLAAWSLAAIAASGLSGGLTGPLGGFVFMPLVAAVALGSSRLVPFGALGAVLAVLAGLIAVAVHGPPEVSPGMAAVAALLTAGAAALALRLSAARQARRLAAAEGAMTRIEEVLAGQPGLTMVLDASGAALAAYGAAPAALPVDPLFDEGLIAAVHAPDRPAVQAALAKARAGIEAQVRFAPRLALDRRILLVLRRLDQGDPPRLIALALDATLAHAREAGLEAARAEAEAQNAGKSRFLANMSHELRTPLNAVLGFSDIMRQRLFGPIPDRYADYARSIHEAGGHLLDLINDVLDVSRIEAARYDLTIERFDVREMVSEALSLVRVQADDKGVDLAAVLPPEALTVAAHVIQTGASASVLSEKGLDRARLDAAWDAAPLEARNCTLANAAKVFGIDGPACTDRRAPRAFAESLGLTHSIRADRKAAEQTMIYMNAKAQEQIALTLIARMPPARQ